jgi:hypothetical protein
MKKATRNARPMAHTDVCRCRSQLHLRNVQASTTKCQSSSSPQAFSQKCLTVAGAVFLSLSMAAAPPQVEARARLSPDEQRAVDIFNKSTSSVVNITNLSSRRDAFTSDMQEYPQGAGSGIVWDKQGHIVVCYCFASVPGPEVLGDHAQESI